MTNTNLPPISILEANAQAQRDKLHNSVLELRSTVRQKLDAKKLAREHLGTAASVASVFGLVLGYALGGIFTRD